MQERGKDMKNSKKIWWISLGCVCVGLILTILGLVLGGRMGFYINGTGIHAPDYSVKPYVQEKKRLDEFDSMDITANYADIEILPSDGYYIEYRLDGESSQPTLKVENQKLVFKGGNSVGTGGFHVLVFGSFGSFNGNRGERYVKLYIPKDKYFTSVRLKSDDGSMEIGDISAETMEIKNAYGNVKVGSFQGSQFEAHLSDGDLYMESLDSDHASLENNYGACKFGTIKGMDFNIKMNDGDFSAAKADVTDFTVKNDYGSVKIGLAKDMKEYDFDLKTEYGTMQLPRDAQVIEGNRYHTNDGAENRITVKCEDGDIVITK